MFKGVGEDRLGEKKMAKFDDSDEKNGNRSSSFQGLKISDLVDGYSPGVHR